MTTKFHEYTVKRADPHADGTGWTVHTTYGTAITAPSHREPTPPAPGETLRCYGEGMFFSVHGIAIGGRVYRYESPETWRAKELRTCGREVELPPVCDEVAALRARLAQVTAERDRMAGLHAAVLEACNGIASAMGCRADDLDDCGEAVRLLVAERDAAIAARDALAGAVAAVRAARVAASAAGARYSAAWDTVVAMPPTALQSEEIAQALRVSYEAQDALWAALDALLTGTPVAMVRASVVDLGRRKTHGLKVWPGFFAAILDGSKTFEVRRCDDRTFAVGDALWLREWSQADGYTGRAVARVIVYVVSGPPFLPEGVAVLGLAALNAALAAAGGV